MVGTVTKPVVGMLDLASETATAIRETSRRYSLFFQEICILVVTSILYAVLKHFFNLTSVYIHKFIMTYTRL